jgi:hypothetical protein
LAILNLWRRITIKGLTMTTPDLYLDDYRRHGLITALINCERTPDAIQLVLCDFGIWPRSILGDVIRARIEAGQDELSNVAPFCCGS